MDHRTALLVIDVISDFSFEDGKVLFPRVKNVAGNIARLKRKFLDEGKTVLYVNDNEEGKIANVERLFDTASSTSMGREILKRIEPEEDLVLLKPQRSGFYGTDLEKRLRKAYVTDVVVVGWTTDICVLFTAHDAYMRKFKVRVPSDCTNAIRPTHHSQALTFLRRVAEADVSPFR